MFTFSTSLPLSLTPISNLSENQSGWKRPLEILDIMEKTISEKTFKAYVKEGKTLKIQLKELV